MPASQSPKAGTRPRHGSQSASLAELRRRLGTPENLENRHRQRLRELATRLARVQALGGGYTGLDLSDYAKAAMDRQPALV